VGRTVQRSRIANLSSPAMIPPHALAALIEAAKLKGKAGAEVRQVLDAIGARRPGRVPPKAPAPRGLDRRAHLLTHANRAEREVTWTGFARVVWRVGAVVGWLVLLAWLVNAQQCR
jgi:hypothetical protein